MKLLALSVLLLLACAAFVKAENEAPAQEEEDSTYELDMSNEESDDASALTDATTDQSANTQGKYIRRCGKWRCIPVVVPRRCVRLRKSGYRVFFNCSRSYRYRSCHQNCYLQYYG